jgi:hypothetical protein
MMPPENLDSCAIYNITYLCKMCIPVENTLIIGQIKVKNPEISFAANGPIMIIIPKENVDTNIWDITDGYKNKKDNRKLAINDFVKIQILQKRNNQNDTIIKAIGKLIDFATPDEVTQFFGSKINKTNEPGMLNDTDTQDNIDTESNFII